MSKDGFTWQKLNLLSSRDASTDDAIPGTALAISPDFAADRTVIAGTVGGILLSTDAGQNWQAIAFPPPPPLVSALVFSPDYSRDGVLLAGTMEDGVFRSADHGFHWSAWNFGLLDLGILCLAISPSFASDEIIFAGTESGIFRSANGGRAWREVDLGIGFEAVLSLALSPDFSKDGVLYAGTESQGLLVSKDHGRRWTRVGKDIFEDPINSVLLSPGDPASGNMNILALCGRSILFSQDGGNSWVAQWEELTHEQQVTALLAPFGCQAGQPVWLGLESGETKKVVIRDERFAKS
jgi:photosystem II stability/assembly factor-like uncharacterized protein